MPGERMRVEAKCLGNAWECRGIQGNSRGTYGSGCKVPGECRGMPGERMAVGANSQGNARERKKNARGTYGSECKVPGECRGMTREST